MAIIIDWMPNRTRLHSIMIWVTARPFRVEEKAKDSHRFA